MVRGRGGGRVDRMMPGQAQAAAAGMLPVAGDPDGSLIAADELPDGLVIADHAGCVIVFNRAAGRITGITPSHALGQDVRHALPLQDADGRSWWAQARPYHGLSTRTRHPERSLYLPCGTELLVTVGYVRDPRREARGGWHREPGAVRRIVITIRGAQQRARIERGRADLVSTVAHELRSPLTSDWSCSRRSTPTPTGSPGSLPSYLTCPGSRRAASRCTASSWTCRSGPAGLSPGGSRPATTRAGSGWRSAASCRRPGWTPTRSTRSWATW